MFSGRKLIIATKHHKEEVIAPRLEDGLGVTCIVPKGFDTDNFGTFSGEKERITDPITTARNKCLKALEITGASLGVASEGSFGPHPSLFFTNGNDELIIFIDQKNGLEIIAKEISSATNFSGKEVRTSEELLDFARTALFPSHGLILKKAKDDHTDMVKGINTESELLLAFNKLIKANDSVYVETDMRAMYNPSRMKIIESATKKLVDKINSRCPKCEMPGFDVTDRKTGLTCELCGSPTKSALSYIYECQHCRHVEEKLYPLGKKTEDPMYCDFCNP